MTTETLIISTLLQGYTAYEEGQTAAAQARATAAWRDYNAKVSQREAEAERQATIYEAKQHARESKQLLARGRAIRGKAGVTVEGSPLLAAEDTAGQLAMERSMIRLTGARRVSRLKSRSILDVSKARAARISARGYKEAGYLGAGTSLLRGATKGYEMGLWE